VSYDLPASLKFVYHFAFHLDSMKTIRKTFSLGWSWNKVFTTVYAITGAGTRCCSLVTAMLADYIQ
jgi:hypothetical protein